MLTYQGRWGWSSACLIWKLILCSPCLSVYTISWSENFSSPVSVLSHKPSNLCLRVSLCWSTTLPCINHSWDGMMLLVIAVFQNSCIILSNLCEILFTCGNTEENHHYMKLRKLSRCSGTAREIKLAAEASFFESLIIRLKSLRIYENPTFMGSWIHNSFAVALAEPSPLQTSYLS